MSQNLTLTLSLIVSASLFGCLDPNELDAPQYATNVEVPFDDTGRPFDPRDEIPTSGADVGADATDPEDGGGGEDVAVEDTPPVTECDDERPCTAPFVCEEGFCLPECEVDDECANGFVCREFACIEEECSADTDCEPFDEICDTGLCEPNPCNLQLFTFEPSGTTYSTVHIAGSFNEWSETAAGGFELEFLASAGVWWGKFDVPNGSYEYKIVLDETDWIADPANPNGVDDTFGGENSLLIVECSETPGVGACGDLEAFDWRDTVMYFAMIDRFYDGDGSADPVSGATDGDSDGPSGQYEGGDLQGVTDQMDYLTELGVTALWLSAPYENRDTAGAAIDPDADPNFYSGYHGYWPSPANVDYSDPENPSPVPAVESRVGDADDLHALVAAAHGAESANGQGVKVLFDYVMNHVDVESELYAAHNDWFARRDGDFALCGPDNLWDDPFWGTRCAFTDYLPPFDFDVAPAREWSINDAIWWAKEFDIDGYRLDAIKHVSLQWLTDLRARLNSEFPEPEGGKFYLVGETFAYDDRDLLARFIDPDTMLDGQFDFPFKARVCEAVFTPGGSLADFAGWIAGNDTFYGQDALMTTWIGNHDIPRSIHFASGEIGNCRQGSFPGNGWTNEFNQPSDAAPYERLGVVFAIMMTNPGIPLIYYGDEIGLAGGGDPDNRRMMVFEDSELSAPQIALRDNVSVLARIRAENPVVARGRRITRSSSRDTWVYSMVGCGEGSPDVTIAINRADSTTSVSVPAGSYEDLVDGEAVDGGSISVPGRGFRVIRRN
ncbi:MAG: glycosidase [Bradymonadia bacterium]|jgi:glycosidase